MTATALREPKGAGIVLALAISCTSWLLQGWDGALWVHGVTHSPPPRTPLAPGLARALLEGRATLPFSSCRTGRASAARQRICELRVTSGLLSSTGRQERNGGDLISHPSLTDWMEICDTWHVTQANVSTRTAKLSHTTTPASNPYDRESRDGPFQVTMLCAKN